MRINSRELNIKDPHYYSYIHTPGSRRFNRDPMTVRAFNVTTSIAATVDHDLRRIRRAYLSHYFSKRSIVGIEPMIHNRTNKLCRRLEEFMREGETVTLGHAFAAMTADIISYHMLDEYPDYLLRAPTFAQCSARPFIASLSYTAPNGSFPASQPASRRGQCLF